MEINSHSIKLTGMAEIPEPLEIGEDITVGLNLTLYAAETKNNDDGFCSVVYKARPNGEILITEKHGKTIRAKVKGSPQTRYHFALSRYHAENHIEEDFSSWYPKFIDQKIAELNL